MTMNRNKTRDRAWHRDKYDEENDDVFEPKFEEDLRRSDLLVNSRFEFFPNDNDNDDDDGDSRRQLLPTTPTNLTSSGRGGSGIYHLSESAIKRREKLIESQSLSKKQYTEKLKSIQLSKNSVNRIKKGLGKVGKTINKFNPGKWIDDLEKDQILADELEVKNKEFIEEQERISIMKEAEEACMNAIRTHLYEFIDENPNGKYEEWIAELHPENVKVDKDGIPIMTPNSSTPIIDHRFYVQESDHRIMWNENRGMYEDCDDDHDDNNNNNDDDHLYARSFVESRHTSGGVNLTT